MQTEHPIRPPAFECVTLSLNQEELVFIDQDGIESRCPARCTAEEGRPERQLALLAALEQLKSLADQASRRQPTDIEERGYTLRSRTTHTVPLELMVGGRAQKAELSLDDLRALEEDLRLIDAILRTPATVAPPPTPLA